MKNRKILSVLVLVVVIMCWFMMDFNKVYAYQTTKQIRTLKTGDVIYYDNSDTNWDTVKIYTFSKDAKDSDGNSVWGDEKFSWANSPEMEKVEGTDNIYKYEITQDLEIENNYNNHVIFRNGSGNSQTINLGFIESGYVFKSDKMLGSKYDGDWYVYDKTELKELIIEAKKYQDDAQYYTETSIQNLNEQIEKAESILEEDIIVRMVQLEGNIVYTTDFDEQLVDLDNAINNLVLNKNLDTAIDEDKYIPNSVEEYKQKIEEIEQEVNTNQALTVQDIKNAIQKVKTAKAALVTKPDKTSLEETINTATSIEESKYTTETIEILKTALENANKVLQDENATADKVSEANEALKVAINGLEEITVTNEVTSEESTTNDLVSSNEFTSSNPQTGDRIYLIVAVLMIAVVIFVAIEFIKRKNIKQKNS